MLPQFSVRVVIRLQFAKKILVVITCRNLRGNWGKLVPKNYSDKGIVLPYSGEGEHPIYGETLSLIRRSHSGIPSPLLLRSSFQGVPSCFHRRKEEDYCIVLFHFVRNLNKHHPSYSEYLAIECRHACRDQPTVAVPFSVGPLLRYYRVEVK